MTGLGKIIEEARLVRYEPAARKAVEDACALAESRSQAVHPLHLFAILLRRHREDDAPTVGEDLVEREIARLSSSASPGVTSDLYAVLDDAEQRTGQGAWVTALHLEDAIEASELPEITAITKQLSKRYR